MKKIRDKSRIYIQKWLEAKPYKSQVPSDDYYLKLANKVRGVLASYGPKSELSFFLKDEVGTLACLLTAYFEDIISGTNIWNTFIKLHKRMYGKRLPFYDIDGYYENEINMQDVAFLIWYMISLQEEEYIYPRQDFIMTAAEDVMEIFEKEWEVAPENTHLVQYYKLDPNELDFFQIRLMIERILFDTYLFYYDTGMELKEEINYTLDEIARSERRIEDHYLSIIFYEVKVSLIYKSHTAVLGLKGQEWLAEMLGEAHPLYQDILNISPRVTGLYSVKGYGEELIYLEHVASGLEFEVANESLGHNKEALSIGDLANTSLVRWKDKWWVNGSFAGQPRNKEEMKKEKRSLVSLISVNFLKDNEDKQLEVLAKQENIFRKMTGGQPIAFRPFEKVEGFINSFHGLYQKCHNASEKEIDKIVEKAREGGFHEPRAVFEPDMPRYADEVAIFFNPKSGIEEIFDLNSALPLPNNPYFNEADTKEHLLTLMTSDDISTELVQLAIDLCRELPYWQSDEGKVLWEHMDFLLRFWKKGEYFTKPNISVVDDVNTFKS